MMRRWVRRIEGGAPTVVALGGGAFVHPGNFDLIENHGISIWLDCSFEEICRRIGDAPVERPLTRIRRRFASCTKTGGSDYGRADFRIEGHCDPESAVEAILRLPLWK